MSPKMSEFLKSIPGIAQEEFERRVDSANDEFIDEYLRLMPEHGYRREYVAQVQLRRRHQQLLAPRWHATPGFWVAVLAMIFAAIAAWPVIVSWFRP